jgi:NTE family protein
MFGDHHDDPSAAGEIKGFVMPYLGQVDERLPVRPSDLVPRQAVVDYPTDFNPMSKANVEKLSTRSEQPTNALLDVYAPDL